MPVVSLLANATLARKAVQEQHLSRADFKSLFETLFEKQIPEVIAEKLEQAEKVRDRAIHGREPSEARMRAAVVDLLDYARDYNAFVHSLAHFQPFGSLQGFHGGRAKGLDNSTTRLLLLGVGFTLA